MLMKLLTLSLISLLGISYAQITVTKIGKVGPVSGTGIFNGTYTSGANDTYKFTITAINTMQSGWSASLNVGGNTADISPSASSDTVTASLNSGSSQTFTLTINAGVTANQYSTVKIEIFSSTSLTALATQNITLYAHPTSLLIDKTSIGFFQQNYFGTNPNIKMAYSAELASLDTVGFNKNNVDHIVCNLSIAAAASLNDNELTNLTHYLEGGGKLMLCGEDILSSPPSGVSGYTVFVGNYLGVSPTTGTTGSTWTIDPLATSEWVFGSLATGASLNTGSYGAMSPDTLTPTGANTTAILKYNNAQNAAVRNMSSTAGGWRVVFTAFRYEALQPISFKTSFLDRVIKWFDGAFDGIAPEELSNIMLGQNYPNPASEITTIPMEKINTDVAFKLMDMQGRIVVSKQIPARSGSLKIDVSNLNAGIYFYQLGDKNNSYAAKKLMVAH